MTPEDSKSGERTPDLFALVMAATRQKWDFVDEHLDAMCTPDNLEKAARLFNDANGHVRDLAASIFERSNEPLPEGVPAKLEQQMQSDTDEFARYRAAFALFKHGERSPVVMETLQKATEVEDVAEIAKKYLAEKKG